MNFSFGVNLASSLVAILFRKKLAALSSASAIALASPSAKGATKTLACFKSGDMRTSPTVTETSRKAGSWISPRAKISTNRCFIFSPARNWRWVGPKLSLDLELDFLIFPFRHGLSPCHLPQTGKEKCALLFPQFGGSPREAGVGGYKLRLIISISKHSI